MFTVWLLASEVVHKFLGEHKMSNGMIMKMINLNYIVMNDDD